MRKSLKSSNMQYQFSISILSVQSLLPPSSQALFCKSLSNARLHHDAWSALLICDAKSSSAAKSILFLNHPHFAVPSSTSNPLNYCQHTLLDSKLREAWQPEFDPLAIELLLAPCIEIKIESPFCQDIPSFEQWTEGHTIVHPTDLPK